MNDDDELSVAHKLIAAALGIPVPRAADLKKIYDVPEWDSEGQLNIVLALEESTGRDIKDEEIFERLTIVGEIARFISDAKRENESEKRRS
ncbi:MAG: hypothetical protein KDD60_12315 [Bdellovibrionales bacterium]|nr:hypothetical protein [Bdellovibrionales bacterium]